MAFQLPLRGPIEEGSHADERARVYGLFRWSYESLGSCRAIVYGSEGAGWGRCFIRKLKYLQADIRNLLFLENVKNPGI